jgi:hypothetical protein
MMILIRQILQNCVFTILASVAMEHRFPFECMVTQVVAATTGQIVDRKTPNPCAIPNVDSNDYSLILHCIVGHMHRVDGALPDLDYGEKAVNFLAPPPTPMYIFYIFYILFILFIFLFLKAYQSYVATSLWIMVLFHDSSCNRTFTSASPAQISSENRF